EITELRAEAVLQVGLGPLSDQAQVAQRLPGLAGDLRQLIGAEDDQRDHRENQDLREGQVEHEGAPASSTGGLAEGPAASNVDRRAARQVAGRDRPDQRSRFSQEASRRKPRAIRAQNPSRVVPGRVVTTWPTVAIGASAITV